MGFKPMFEEERLFFKEKTGIDLPSDCWRNGSKIYLDFTCKKPLLTFKVIDKQILITKDNSELFIEYSQKSVVDLIRTNIENLNLMFDKSVEDTYNYVITNPNKYYVISHSGGKDSDLTYMVWEKVLAKLEKENNDIFSKLRWIINFANTSNDTADTYRKIKKLPKEKLNILNPKMGWRQWLVDVKNYFIPSKMVRNCCAQYKEGQITKAYSKDEELVNVLGVRRYESTKRSEYIFLMDSEWRDKHFNTNNLPEKWINLAPIVDWKDEEVWLYLIHNNVDFNRMYRLGFGRVGCLLCPFQQDYIDLLIEKYYPTQWKWWLGVLEKNYEIYGIKNSLKWTLEEWKNGRWKTGISKEYEIINRKKTPERVKELAGLKGISEEMAAKFFDKTCKCGKKMNPGELAMFYKIYGRYEDTVDNRDLLCKKCLCKDQGITSKEYTAKSIEFMNSGCNLF